MGLTILISAFRLPSFKGATLGKGLNRMLATLSGSALGVGVHYLATLSGETGQPIVIGFFVFMIGTYVTRHWHYLIFGKLHLSLRIDTSFFSYPI
jgi:hypothetical protein